VCEVGAQILTIRDDRQRDREFTAHLKRCVDCRTSMVVAHTRLPGTRAQGRASKPHNAKS
jgi:hypothetical protein